MIGSAGTDRSSSALQGPDEMAALRTIAEAGGDLAFVIDRAGPRLRYLSPLADQLLGYSAAQLQAHLSDPGLAGPLAVLADAFRRLPDAARAAELREVEVARPDATSVQLQLIATAVRHEAGVPVSWAGIIRDRSALHALQAEQKRFAGMLNHEFRTPLAVIDGAIQRLEATAGGADEATRQRYRKIGAAVDRLIGMLDVYLSPERMAALGKPRAAGGVDPRAQLHEVAAQASAAGRPVEVSADELPGWLRGDEQGLRLALKVLVDNALAFSPAGSPIALAGRSVANGVELSVRDHGPGVPASDTGRIFDKSYRGSNAAGLPGSGLGLYMARSIVEVHGGTLELDGEARPGALFKIWLPTTLNGGKVVASAEPSSDNRLKQAGETP